MEAWLMTRLGLCSLDTMTKGFEVNTCLDGNLKINPTQPYDMIRSKSGAGKQTNSA